MTDVIEAMCLAYWNARGSVKWEKEPECQKALVRERMRAAFVAMHEFDLAAVEADLKVSENELATKTVPAPVSDPKPRLFSHPSIPDIETYADIIGT